MRGREQTVELEVARHEAPTRVRMISDAGGTVWDTLFTVFEDIDQVTLQMQMDIKPYALPAGLTVPLIKGMVIIAIESDWIPSKPILNQSRIATVHPQPKSYGQR